MPLTQLEDICRCINLLRQLMPPDHARNAKFRVVLTVLYTLFMPDISHDWSLLIISMA